MPTRPITFLSDYGLADEFVGVCHAVIARLAPEARVIDLAHGVRAHDVRHGARVLAATLPYAPAGIHLAVVDPGVGGERRAVALRLADEERHLVGPDNGLLSLAWQRFGGVSEAVEVSRSPVRLEPVSATFHGRDLFAPVAAHLARGAPLEALGEPIDPAGLVALEVTAAQVEDGRLVAEVSHTDGFGNVALSATEEDATRAGLELGEALRIDAGGGTHDAVYARTFADAAPGELLLLADSTGLLALARNSAGASAALGVEPAARIEISARRSPS